MGTVRISNDGPEALIVALRRKTASTEAFYPQGVLNANSSMNLDIEEGFSVVLVQATIQSASLDVSLGVLGGSIMTVGNGDSNVTPQPTPTPVAINEPFDFIDFTWDNGNLTIVQN